MPSLLDDEGETEESTPISDDEDDDWSDLLLWNDEIDLLP